MNLYLDTEFNGHAGELISLALAAPDGKHWYGIYPPMVEYTPWVVENVLPMLAAMPVTIGPHSPGYLGWREKFRASLREYLEARAGAVIYADWPADFQYLMWVMAGPSYNSSWNVDLNMRLLTTSYPKPKFPHNALSDAIALMNWHVGHA